MIGINIFSKKLKSSYTILAILISSTCLSQININFGKPITDYYPEHIYNAGDVNMSMLLADSGLLYSGNGEGILEYDGSDWRLIKTTNQGAVISLSKADDGTIYVGANGSFGYLQQDIYGQMQYIDISTTPTFSDKPFGEVKTAFAFDGKVYFAANKWLFRLNRDKTISSWFYQNESLFTDVFTFEDKIYFTSQKHNYQLNSKDELEITHLFSDSNNKRIHVIETIKTNDKEVVFSMNDLFIKKDRFHIWQTKAAEILHKTWMFDVIRYNSDYFVVSTLRKGVFIVSNDGSEIVNISKENGLPNEASLGIAVDNQDGLWIANMGSGISRLQSPLSIRINNDDLGLSKINKIISYNNHLIGISLSDIAVLKLNRQKNQYKFEHFKLDTDQLFTLIDSKINGLLVGGYWGIDLLEIDFDKLSDSVSKPLVRGVILVSEIIASPTSSTNFFVRLKNGLAHLSFRENTWHYHVLKDFKKEVVSFAFDDYGLWLSLITGEIKRIKNYEDSDNLVYESYEINEDHNHFKVKIFPSSNGIIVSLGKQLFEFDENTNKFVTLAKIKSKTEIELIEQDNQGQIWLANKTDIIKFKDKKFENGEVILSKVLLPSITNSIFFDKTNKSTFINRNDGVVVISGEVKPFGAAKPRINSIQSSTHKLPLGATQLQQHDLQFSISNADFSHANDSVFRLCLSEKQCTNWSDSRSINFNNIAGDDYNLKLYAKDKNEVITTTQMKIKVVDYWYQTLWFKFLAAFVTLLVFYLIGKFSTYRLKKRNEQLEVEISKRTRTIEKQAEELHQLDKARLRFFSNVSHEFRTPLTLAIAPLESLLSDKPELENDISHPVKTSLANSKKMLSLVGEILDIKRLEAGRFPLRVAQYDVADLINQLIIRFKPWADKNNQTLTTNNTHEPKLLYFDQEQIDRCLSNLISNAIKYAGKNTKITLSILQKSQKVGLKVADNGGGISKESEGKIFDRYYQDEQSEKISDAGTGIGLSLVDELMQLHHGSVEMINKPEEGCEFILWLQQGKEHFDEKQLTQSISNDTYSVEINEILPSLPNRNTANTSNEKDITTVLIVDDNIELCDFIASRISTYYHVLQEHNGADGLATAIEKLPDLIISDVMMPEMNGLEMSAELKSNKITQCIPIILLTAKSSKREIVEGLQTGADDYLSKPFDSSELIMRVAGLINNRKRIRETMQLEFSQSISRLNNKDDFIQSLTKQIHQNMAQPEFSVEKLAEKLALSQSSLQRKCKEKFEKTPIAYIRQVRMQQALTMLKQKNYSVSEIAYATGFESLSYFSRTFKKHYGKSPSSI